MGYGKPCVTFTIEGSGVNYVALNEVNCIEVPNRDSKAFADAIVTLASNEDLRKEFGENARTRFEELFTYEKYKENIANLLKF